MLILTTFGILGLIMAVLPSLLFVDGYSLLQKNGRRAAPLLSISSIMGLVTTTTAATTNQLLLLPPESWNASAENEAAASTTTNAAKTKSNFQRYPQIRFTAALGDPSASSGTTDAEQWRLWRDDPGLRGVYLRDYGWQLGSGSSSNIKSKTTTDGGGVVAPAGWTLQKN
jgi:hypothetical protein